MQSFGARELLREYDDTSRADHTAIRFLAISVSGTYHRVPTLPPRKRPAQPKVGPRVLVGAGLCALGLIQLYYLSPLFVGKEPFGEDLSIHLLEIQRIAEALRHGDPNLWNTSANLGFPSGYYYQILPQLVPAVLFVVFAGHVSLVFWFKFALTVPFLLLPASTYYALRQTKLDEVHCFGAATAVGFVFGASPWGLGADSLFTTGLYTQAWAMIVYPLALVFVDRYVTSGTGFLEASVTALFCGLCHPFVAFSLAVPVLVRAVWQRPFPLARLCWLLVGILGMSAFFWLPILVHYDSFGAFPARNLGEHGIRARAFFEMLFRGEFLDVGRLPVLTFLFAIGLLVRRIAGPTGTWLSIQAVVFGALIVLGTTSFGRIGDDLLPAIRFLAPMQFAMACVAGIAAAHFVRRGYRLRARGARWAALLASTAFFVYVAAKSGGVMRERVRTADALPSIHRGELDAVVEFLRHSPPGRVLGADVFGTGSHWWMYLPPTYAGQMSAIVAFGGAAFQSSANFVSVRKLTSTNARFFNLRYVLAMSDRAMPWKGARSIFQSQNVTVYEVPNGGSFVPVSVVRSAPVERVARRKATAEWLLSGESGKNEVYAIGWSTEATDTANTRVVSENEAPSRFSAAIEVTESPAVVALTQTYHPAWRVTIDGAPATLRRVTPDFPAVVVPVGSHAVVFRFVRPWWTFVLMLLPLGTWALAAARAASARRSQGSSARA